jgi:hypothetical protein
LPKVIDWVTQNGTIISAISGTRGPLRTKPFAGDFDMGLVRQIGLTCDGVAVSSSELSQVAAALSKQVQRDFAEIWEVSATVDGFPTLEDVPAGHWPIIIMNDPNGGGYHTDKNGQPFAIVDFGTRPWSLTASHECMEMLADPFGNRLQEADLLEQAVEFGESRDRVRYLVEVCDPSESGQFSYSVNGELVSDFYTPQFFDPLKSPGVRYSFTGAIDGPRKVLDGGYISWERPTDGHWLQLRMFSDQFVTGPHVLDLTDKLGFTGITGGQSLRAAIDRVTRPPKYEAGLRHSQLTAARGRGDSTAAARRARARELRALIATLR